MELAEQHADRAKVLFTDGFYRLLPQQSRAEANVKFDLAVPEVANERVTVYIKQNSVKDILELVSSLIDMPYKQVGNVVRLAPHNSTKQRNPD